MKITKQKLKEIIKEEIEAVLSESMLSADVYLKKIKDEDGEKILKDLMYIALNDPDTMQGMPKNVTPQGAVKVLRAIAGTLGSGNFRDIRTMVDRIYDATEPCRVCARRTNPA